MRTVGRLTSDATVREVTGGSKVVDFTVAENYRYNSKGVKKNIVTYFDCSLWNREKLADFLNKGSLVEINGTATHNTYTNKKGETVSKLAIRVNEITFHGGAKKSDETQAATEKNLSPAPVDLAIKPSKEFDNIPVPENDLPF